jgi:hypothetical protein
MNRFSDDDDPMTVPLWIGFRIDGAGALVNVKRL